MKNIKKLVSMALILTTVLTSVGCSSNQNTQSNISATTVLAEVAGEKILLKDVDAEISTIIDSLKEEYGDELTEDTLDYLNTQRVSVLQQLVQEKILLKKAEELKLIPDEKELNSKIEEQIKSLVEYYGSEEDLNKAKESYGYTDESFNEFIKNQVIQEIVVNEITKDITVSEDEISKFYEDNKDIYFTKNEGAYAQHILFETEEDAKEAKALIDSGESSFEDLFEKYSTTEESTENESSDEITYPKAEDLGFVEYEQEYFDTDFLAGFKEVKEGEVSNPVKSSFGYHLIKATDILKEKIVTPLDEVKESISSEVEYQKKYELFQNKLVEWEEEYNLKYSADSIGYNPEEE